MCGGARLSGGQQRAGEANEMNERSNEPRGELKPSEAITGREADVRKRRMELGVAEQRNGRERARERAKLGPGMDPTCRTVQCGSTNERM